MHEKTKRSMNMDQNKILLESIVENARMGEDACDQLLTRAEDNAIRQELMLERQQYADILRAAEQKMCEMKMEPHAKGMMSRMGMWMGMQMNTAMNRSAAHIAEITFQGAGMGIAEITKAVNSNPNADAEVKGIAQNMIEMQQQAIDRLKPFLKQKSVVK